jgi:hypothetical protein
VLTGAVDSPGLGEVPLRTPLSRDSSSHLLIESVIEIVNQTRRESRASSLNCALRRVFVSSVSLDRTTMDPNASVARQQTTATQQNARSLTSGRPSAPAQSHHPSESTSSRAALNPKTSKAPSTSRFSLGNLRKPQPAVFWNDKKSLDQGQQRTFYNDVTPPPSPSYAGGESKNSLSIGYPSFGKTPPVGEERGTTGRLPSRRGGCLMG